VDAQGLSGARYRVVLRTLVFLRRRGQVLLMRRPLTATILPGSYNGVGGHVDPGEDIVSSALREVREETGLVLRRLCPVGVIHVTEAEQPSGVLVFVLAGEVPDSTSQLTPSDEGELLWVDLESIASLPVVPDVPAIVSRIWPTIPNEPPGFFVARAPQSGDGPPSFVTTSG
jgi:8-oxo-dGTP diphosphatase